MIIVNKFGGVILLHGIHRKEGGRRFNTLVLCEASERRSEA